MQIQGHILQVVVVELCKDRVGLMLNPEGPKGAQLWNSRRVSISGVPSEPGWPQEEQILSGKMCLPVVLHGLCLPEDSEGVTTTIQPDCCR